MSDADNRFEQVVNEDAEPRRLNLIAMVLDRSGSMAPVMDEAIGAFNDQIRTTREATEDQPIDVLVSLVTFASEVDEPVYWNVPLHQVNEFTKADYIPGGWTAMRDAVGFTIDRLKQHPDIDDENTTVLVVIISDGAENNSREYSPEALAERVNACQDTNRWTFVYEGANQDLAKVSQATRIAKGNMLGFDATVQGMQQSGMLRQQSVTSYYRGVGTGEVTCSTNFYNQTGGTGRALDIQDNMRYTGDTED